MTSYRIATVAAVSAANAGLSTLSAVRDLIDEATSVPPAEQAPARRRKAAAPHGRAPEA
jgi:hypothetical protein